MPAKRTLRDLLLEDGLCDAGAVEAVERAALRRGSTLLVGILEERLVDPGDLLEMIRRHLKVPEVDLDRMVVEPEAVREVPLPLAEGHVVLPLRIERRGGRPVMWLAMADPLDARAIEEIEFSTGCLVEPALASAADILAAIKRSYQGIVTKIIRNGATQVPPPSEPRARPTADAAREGVASAGLHTTPVHRLEDEATPELRIRAIMNALARRGLLSEEEYLEELSALLKARFARGE
jgi:type IV pilus assembly protein PilB